VVRDERTDQRGVSGSSAASGHSEQVIDDNGKLSSWNRRSSYAKNTR
jgi:hypothetical protein